MCLVKYSPEKIFEIEKLRHEKCLHSKLKWLIFLLDNHLHNLAMGLYIDHTIFNSTFNSSAMQYMSNIVN